MSGYKARGAEAEKQSKKEEKTLRRNTQGVMKEVRCESDNSDLTRGATCISRGWVEAKIVLSDSVEKKVRWGWERHLKLVLQLWRRESFSTFCSRMERHSGWGGKQKDECESIEGNHQLDTFKKAESVVRTLAILCSLHFTKEGD